MDNATHYVESRRKMPAVIAGLLGRLRHVTGISSLEIRQHCPGNSGAYYNLQSTDGRGLPVRPHDLAVKGRSALEAALRAACQGAELSTDRRLRETHGAPVRTAPIVSVTLHGTARATNNGHRIFVWHAFTNGMPIQNASGATMPGIYCSGSGDCSGGILRKICTAIGVDRAKVYSDAECTTITRKRDECSEGSAVIETWIDRLAT